MWLRALEMHRRFDASADAHYFEMQEAGYQANIGSAEERLGNLGAARDAYESARDVFQRLGEAWQEGRAWVNLGTLHAEENAHEEAIKDSGRAEQIATDAGDAEGRELALGAMGNSLAELERLDEARSDARDSAGACSRTQATGLWRRCASATWPMFCLISKTTTVRCAGDRTRSSSHGRWASGVPRRCS